MNCYQSFQIDEMNFKFTYPLFFSILVLFTAELICYETLPKSYIKGRSFSTCLFLAGCYVFTYFYFSEKSLINIKQKQLQEYSNKIEKPDTTIIKYSLI